MSDAQAVKDFRKERLRAVIETHFSGSRRAFCERIGITKGRVSQMLIESFGEGVARSLETELGLPSYFLDGTESKNEQASSSDRSVELVYVTEREQKLLTAFRMAKESGKDFIEKAAKAAAYV